ncbi:MAG: bacteriocin [Sarcina sp.]
MKELQITELENINGGTFWGDLGGLTGGYLGAKSVNF